MHNTSINTTLLKLMWDRYTSVSNAATRKETIVYSVVKVVNLQQEDQRPGIQIYPNPVSRKILIQFDELQTGNFSLELVSTTGQVIERKQVQLSGSQYNQYGSFNQACQWNLLPSGGG